MDSEEIKLQNDIEKMSEEKAKQDLYYTTLELYRYQDMTKDLLQFIMENSNIEEMQEAFGIIKSYGC